MFRILILFVSLFHVECLKNDTVTADVKRLRGKSTGVARRDTVTVLPKGSSRFCEYQGYTPGQRASISSTTAPMATIQTNVLQDIFVDDTMNAVVGGIGVVGGLAGGPMGTALGFVTGLFGTIGGVKTPSYTDILDATNDAIKELAVQLDTRMDEMQEYVDREIIRLLKDINRHKYKFLFTYWAGCVRGPSKEQKACQRQAINLIQASVGDFAMYYDQLDIKNEEFHQLSEEKQKRLEVNLVLFRNYAFLSLMSLQVMKKTYENTENENGIAYKKMYHCMLKSKIKFYKAYVKAAVKEVVKLNAKYDLLSDANVEYHVSDMGKSHFNGEMAQLQNVVCKFKMSPRITGDNPCRLHYGVDIRGPAKRFTIDFPDEHAKETYPKRYCKTKLNEYFEKYKVEEEKAVKDFWNSEVAKVLERADSLISDDDKNGRINCDVEMKD